MFKRLLKHQLKSTWKEFNIAYACIAVLGILLGFALNSKSDVFITIISIIFTFAVFGIIGLIVHFYIKLFYKTTYGKQGYLTFTLPISTHALIISKIVSALLYMLGTFISVVFSALMLIIIVDPGILKEIFPALGNVLNLLNINPFVSFLYIFQGSVSLIAELVLIQFVCAYTQTLVNSKKKENMVFLVYIVASIAISMVMAFDPIGFGIVINAETGSLHVMRIVEIGLEYIPIFSFWALIVEIAKMVGLYFWTIHVIDKKIEIQ